MNTKERILSIRLMEHIKKQPAFAKELHMKAVMKEPDIEQHFPKRSLHITG